jgi:hypothetical protein
MITYYELRMSGKEAALRYFVDIPTSSLINKENNGKVISLFWPALEPAASRSLREYAQRKRKVHVVVKWVTILFRIRKARFPVSVQSSVNLLVVSRGFRSPSRKMPLFYPRPFPSTSFAVPYLLIILQFDAM